MNKYYATIAALGLLVFCASSLSAATVTLISDDFESYPINNCPCPPWAILNNGAGDEWQVVTDATAHSGQKCMQTKGQWMWAADVYQDLTVPASITTMYFECSIKTPPVLGIDHDDCGFNAMYVAFGYNNFTGTFGVGDAVVQTTPNTWYKGTLKIDATNHTYDFWIDGVLVAKDYPWTGTFIGFNRVTLHAGYGNTVYYFDDVKVWYSERVCGDVNCDGSLDISDAVYLIEYMFGGGSAPCAGCK